MLMKPEKKEMASLILGKMKRPGDETPASAEMTEVSSPEMEVGAEQDDSIAVETAAEEVIAALDSKSPKALVEAMRSLMELLDDRD